MEKEIKNGEFKINTSFYPASGIFYLIKSILIKCSMRIAMVRQITTMNFNFTRNIHFTKLVKTNERLREFNFRMLPGTSNNMLHVDVPDDRGNRIIFKMQRQENNIWKIVETGLPLWIAGNETLLNEAIAEELD